MTTITGRLTEDVLAEIREAGIGPDADAIEDAIRSAIPSAAVTVDVAGGQVTIEVKDADLFRSIISLGLEEYTWRNPARAESAVEDIPAPSLGLAGLLSAVMPPMTPKTA